MPKVRPLTAEQRAKSRWQEADENFRRQVNGFMGAVGMTKREFGARLGIKSETTIRDKIDHPSGLSRCQERMIAELFEEYGYKYDFTHGEATA